MNPNTGAILGMSCKPDFDPNDYKNADSTVYNRNLPIFLQFHNLYHSKYPYPYQINFHLTH